MASENETITDIIAEMRALSNPISDGVIAINGRSIADRLEAAYKRERGNCAKLREALSKFCAYSAVVLNTGMFNRVHLEALLNMAKAALAEPPRNCDVGTVMEQGKRFTAFCYKNRNAESCCGDCPAFNKGTPRGAECELTWAQMPYEAEEGGAK